jgi:hypothetical protein
MVIFKTKTKKQDIVTGDSWAEFRVFTNSGEDETISAFLRRPWSFCVDLGHKVYAEVISRSKC